MEATEPAVAVVVPNWNGADFIGEALVSLQSQSYKNFQIIVVDNGSVDGSIELLQRDFPNVQLIKLDKNYGFAGGVNRGIKAAMEQGAEFVALFNNDAVADADWLKNLLAAANSHAEAGIITGKFLLMDKGTLDTTGDQYSIWGWPFPRGRGEKDADQYDDQNWVLGASGGASLYRAEMLRQVGLFDEDFFAYFEDVDISLRAQLAGWKVYYEPTAKAFHRVGATSSKYGGFTRYHSSKNFVFLYHKNMPASLYWRYLPRYLVSLIGFGGYSLKRGEPIPFLKGITAATVKLPKMQVKRLRIQHQRKVPVKYIDSILYHGWPPGRGGIISRFLKRKLPR